MNNSSANSNDSVSFARIQGTRVLYINDAITDDMAFHFNTTLLQLEHENSKEDITVYINSPGGSVIAGLSMIDTMNLISCDVSTICVGMAASMGAMILMSGQKGKRKILPHSEVLIHQTISTLQGRLQTSDLKILADDAVRTRETLYKILCETTGQPFEKVERDCERDYTLTAQEALEYGIVDEIITSHRERK